MLEIRVHSLMDKVVVSAWCQEYALGHQHALVALSERKGVGDAVEMLEITARCTMEMARRLEQDNLDECTSDCLTNS